MNEKILEALNAAKTELTSIADIDDTVAATLHNHYNVVGVEQGWLKPEYATPLSEQSSVNQTKNIQAVVSVMDGLLDLYTEGKVNEANMVDVLEMCAHYKNNRGFDVLENVAYDQHEQWRDFVWTHQRERVTPGDENFRQGNYDQFNAKYDDRRSDCDYVLNCEDLRTAVLTEKEQDLDRLVVAVVSDTILARTVADYKPMFQ